MQAIRIKMCQYALMTSINPFTLRKNNKLMAKQITNLQKALLITETDLHKASLDLASLRKKNKELNSSINKIKEPSHAYNAVPDKATSGKAAKKTPAK